MASQALSYASPAHGNALCLSGNKPHEYAFIQDTSNNNDSQSIGVQDLLGQAPNGQQQQSSGWDAPGQIHFYPSLPSQPPAASTPFGSSMDSNTGRGASSSNGGGGGGVPVTQQDLFYQPLNSMDMMTDFSFMNRRPTASCSQLIRPVSYYPHTPTSSDAAAESTLTPQDTPLRRSQSDTTSRSASTPTPGPPAMRPTLSQQRRRKLGSSATTMQSARAASVQSGTSTSTIKSSKMAALFVNTKRLPLRLPRPPICLISDPNADLCAHLRRHGLVIEADNYAESVADGMTADFALRTWITVSTGGAEGLLNQTNVFLSQHGLAVNEQIRPSASLPDHFSIPVADLDSLADNHCITPTHMLAVHGMEDNDSSDETKGLLLPCHALMYALQCVSLPCFPTASAHEAGEVKRRLPVVPFRVPRPTEFPTLHRYLYTHDASALLVELLPMKHIARQWDNTKSKQFDITTSSIAHLSNQPPAPTPPPTVPSSATMVLAHLPTQSLFQYAYKIHSAWANGVAIGLLHTQYWSTLDRAWNLVMAALSIKKARIMDTEMRGVQFNPPRTTTTTT